MKRRKFLLATLLAFPAVTFAKVKKLVRPNKPFRVEAGKDRSGEDFFYRGNHFYLKVSGKDTDGDLCVYDTLWTQTGGPQLHLHESQDECFLF